MEIIRIKKEEIGKGKALVSYFEIFILILSTFAFAFIFSEDFIAIGSAQSDTQTRFLELLRNQDSALADIADLTTSDGELDMNAFADALGIEGIPDFGTQRSDTELGCCKEMNDGATCQPLARSQSDECKIGQFVMQACETMPADCAPGCCIDPERGTCSSSSSKMKCIEDGGEYKESKDCQADECRRGCCTLGLTTKFITGSECHYLAENLGLVTDEYSFDDAIQKEAQCLLDQSWSIEKGACIVGYDQGRQCLMTTESQCPTSDFFKNQLCTNPSSEINSTCKPTTNTTCVDGKDEVYFLDSCGNIANIYDADPSKIYSGTGDLPEYWKRVYGKNESCGVNDASASASSPSCGNCFYLQGSRCEIWNSSSRGPEPDYGNLTCKDMSCKDTWYYNGLLTGNEGVDRHNGESWCIYDGWVGNAPYDAFGLDLVTNVKQAFPSGKPLPMFFGKDTVGSRHFRYRCIDGEVIPEPCKDYRNEICVEEVAESEDHPGSDKFSIATCKGNRWRECLLYNSGEGEGLDSFISGFMGSDRVVGLPETVLQIVGSSGMLDKLTGLEDNKIAKDMKMKYNCLKNPDCIIHKVDVKASSKYPDSQDLFKYEVCVPKYPEGFDITSSEGRKAAEQTCGSATQECKAVWIKDGIPPFCSWKCIANCGCLEKDFTKQMNEMCVSLGDCGSYVNFQGLPVEGHSVKKAPNIPMAGMQYSIFAFPIPGYKISPNANELNGILGGESGTDSGAEDGSYTEDSDGVAIGAIDPSSVRRPGKASVPQASLTPVFATAGATGAIAAGSVIAFTAGGGAVMAAGPAAAIASVTGVAGAAGIAGAGVAIVGGLIGALVFKNAPMAAMSTAVVSGIAGLMIVFGANPIVAIVLLILYITIGAIAGCGKKKTVTVKFTCKPSMPPIIGGNCEKCNTDGNNPDASQRKDCTPYRCQSLGRNCIFTEDVGGNPHCVAGSVETQAPKISPLEDHFSEGIRISEQNELGFKFEYEGEGSIAEGCVRPFNSFAIAVKTDEEAQCKIASKPGVKFDEMGKDFGTGHVKNHTILVTVPTMKAAAEGLGMSVEEYLQQVKDGNIRLFVKCQDWFGNTNEKDYEVGFCVQDVEDMAPPSITFSPQSGKKLKWDATTQEVYAFTNKPAQCRWSNTAGVEYDAMTNNMECANIATDFGKYPCRQNLPVVAGENMFYFKCDSNSNKNQQDWPIEGYKLIVTDSKLSIGSITPTGTMMVGGLGGQNFKEIDIIAQTEGGSDNGLATCDYKLGSGQWITFFSDASEMSSEHTQPTIKFFEGTTNIYLKCADSTGEPVENSTSFSLVVDSSVPEVVRAYNGRGVLNIFTNEKAACYYSFNITRGCGFNLDDNEVNTMSFDDSQKAHTTSWEPNKVYFVKCKDVYGNLAGDCSIKVRPSA